MILQKEFQYGDKVENDEERYKRDTYDEESEMDPVETTEEPAADQANEVSTQNTT